jgi:Cu/Zn superoxide dismutase
MLLGSVAIASYLVLWAGLVFAQTTPETRTSSLKGANGQVIGQITVAEAPNVILPVQAKGLALGWRGMHFHEKKN